MLTERKLETSKIRTDGWKGEGGGEGRRNGWRERGREGEEGGMKELVDGWSEGERK